MVSMRSEKPIYALPRLSDVSPTSPLKRFRCLINDSPLSSFQGRSSSEAPLSTPLSSQVIDGVMSLALCLQVVSQAPQQFRSTEKQTTCEGCFVGQCICSVVSLHSSMSRTVHPQEFSKVDVDHRHIPVWASHSTFHLINFLHAGFKPYWHLWD